MRTLLSCATVLVFTAGSYGEEPKPKPEPIDAAKLVGRWEPKEEKRNLKVVIVFEKSGKMSICFNRKGEESKLEGTYTIEGNKILVTLKAAGVDHALTKTVSKLTDTELAGIDEKGKEETLVRLRDK